MLPTPALDLAPLYRRCLLRSPARVASHALMARELSAHDLRWRGGAADTALFKLQSPQLELYGLRYGAAVEIDSAPFDDFALVHLVLRGHTEIEVDGRMLGLRAGQAAVLAPRRRVRLRCSAGAERLILKLPGTLLRSHAGAQDLAPLQGWSAPLNAQWALLLQGLLGALDMGEQADAAWLGHYERTLALFVQAHRGPAALLGIEPAEADSDGARLAALQRHMRAHLAEPLSLAELAAAAGLGLRSLNLLCHRTLGMAPMAVLRQLRLEAARSRLLADPELSVTEVALGCGFAHLGRFAAYYRQRYGEPPGRRSGRG